MENVGLVLEGGGMRGLYTCGILEYFMEKNLYFKYIIGVSAGACNAVSYISKQRGRNLKINIDYCNNWRYMSIRNFLFKGSYIGMDFLFDEIPNKQVKFDYDTFYNSDCNLLVGVTDCKTGEALYFNKEDCNDKFEALRATSSLPIICPIVKYKGYELLDGGISDSIPIVKSIKDGNKKNIIVLTRDKEYRKKPIEFKNLIKFKYRKYPRLSEALVNRYKVYNDTLDYIEELEAKGEVLVIRPSSKITIGRLDRNPDNLKELFSKGYRDAELYYENIEKYINQGVK
ncbi:MAG: patatin-like phospholipase family protein [Solirubrobacterales bacterium]